MASCRAFYLFFFAALSALPYLPVYLESIHLSGAQIGVLAALPRLMGLLGAPLWGLAADAIRRNRPLLILALIGAALSIEATIHTRGFGLLIVLALVFALFHAPIVPLIDHTTIATLGKRRREYGRIRVWGTIGWGLASLLIGWLAERFGLPWAFYAYFAFQAGAVLTTWRLPPATRPPGLGLLRGLRDILRDSRWTLFLLAAFITGMGVAVVHVYLFLYLQELGFPRTFWGLSMVFSTAAELPVMLLGALLLRRFSSHTLLIVSLAALIARCALYSMTDSGALILAAQLLHGPMFGLLWIGGVARASELAPPGLEATAQGLFSGVTMGLGAACGGLVGGAVYGALGAAALFGWTAAGGLAGVALLLAAGGRNRTRPAPGEPVP